MMSNLPPGVSVNMIPGNRPEDEAYEKFWEAFDKKLNETLTTDDWLRYVALMDSPSENILITAVNTALEIGINEGISQEKMNRQIEEAMEHNG